MPAKAYRRRILAIAILSGAVSLPIRALDLVREGKARATIAVAEDARFFQHGAARYIRDYLQEATGCRLPILVDTVVPAKGTIISVGHTQLARAAGITTDDLRWDGCRLVVRGRVLYVLGRDVVPLPACKSVNHLRGAGAQGTARAAGLFVEEHLGVRWFLPTTEGVYVPVVADVTVPDDLNRTFEPTFAYTSLSFRYPHPLDSIAMNQREAIKFRSYGGHSWYAHVPVETYFDEHPEYFRQGAGGKRDPGGEHLCTTNPDVRRIMLAKVRADFDKGYDLVQLGQTDGWRACQCAQCMELDDHTDHRQVSLEKPCNKVWNLHLWIIDECKRSHPDKMLRVMIYGPTWAPPLEWTGLRDNVIGEIAPLTKERLAAWSGKIAGIANWTYWWHANCLDTVFVPATPPRFLQQRFREFRDMGVIGMVGSPQGQWGLGGPSHYVFCKLTGDVDVDVQALVHEYCMTVFGKGGPAMKRFFRILHQRMELTVPFKEMRAGRGADSYPAEEGFAFLYPPKVVARLDRLLRQAESKAQSTRAKNWVQLTRDEFDGVRAVVRMFVLKRAFEVAPTRERLSAVKEAVDEFEAWRERILMLPADYVRKWRPQHNELCAILLTDGRNMTADYNRPDGPPSYYRYHYCSGFTKEEIAAIREGRKSARGRAIGAGLGNRALNAPITWDFDAMAESIGRPVTSYRIVAPRAEKPVTLDGRIDPAEWEQAKAHPFQRYKAAGSKLASGTTTTVRMAFDDQHLYVAYACTEPNIEQLKLLSVGRDGNVYGNDEVELFLNTDPASDRKVMQFMASPVKNALYDARKGYIDDPLHPEYNQWEKTTWNPDWRYAFAIDRKGKRWSLEIAMPFASLGVTHPKPGEAWTCNFARMRRAGSMELSSWIPDTFGSNPELFGELVFGPVAEADPVSAEDDPPTPNSEEDPGNFVKNGGFEENAIGGKPEAWLINSYPEADVPAILDHCIAVRTQAHTGKRALSVDFSEVDFAGLDNATQMYMSQTLGTDTLGKLRGRKVRLSCWVYYEQFTDDRSDGYFPGPTLRVRCWDDQRKPITDHPVPVLIVNHRFLEKSGQLAIAQGTPRWIKFETEGMIPEHTRTADIHGGVVGRSRRTGKLNPVSLFIDDIRLELAE